MQGKGLIKIVALLLFLLSLYQLTFTWKANQIEKEAKADAIEYAENQGYTGDEKSAQAKVYEQNYLDSLNEEKVFLNLFTYKTVKKSALKLGLDLKGGMSVVLEADIPNLLQNLSDDSKNANFLAAIAAAKEDQKSSQEEFIDLFVNNFEGSDTELLNIFQNADNDEELGFNAGKDQIRSYLKDEANDAFDSSYDIIQTRIDRFGLDQPSIQRQDANKRIIIEIPGVDNPTRVRELLTSTANLEFYEVYDNAEFSQFWMAANEEVKKKVSIDEELEAQRSTDIDEGDMDPDELTVENDNPEVQPDSGETTVQDSTVSDPDDISSILGEDISEELDSLELLEQGRKEFPLFQVFQPSQSPGPVVGFATKRDTSKVNEYLRMPEVQAVFPVNSRLVWESKPEVVENEDGTKQQIFRMIALRGDLDGNPQLDGSVIKTASDEVDEYNNPVVSMVMNQEGSSLWYDLTAKNVGKPIAIVLDNKVYSYPAPSEAISGGRSEISGNFTSLEARDLATILKTGKLDVPAKIIEEEVVGPTIGGESARSGVISLVAGLLLVLAFMVLYYGKAGAIADIALIFNLILVIGILAAAGATLTLPGIAGLVLTIGMAVDANVIIFERIREELRKGVGLAESVRKGYKASYSAIIDANVTTLIIAVILFFFGIGPIKGFASVLLIGIITSFFTGVLFTRVIKDDMLKKGKTISYWTGISENWFRNLQFNFVGKRKIAYIVSGIIVLASMLNLAIRQGDAIDLGVDLSSGRSYTVRFSEDASTLEVKNLLDTQLENTSNIVRTFGRDDQLKITTNLMTDEVGTEIDAQAETALYEALKPLLNGNDFETFKTENLMNRQKVDSTIADDLRKQSVWLTVLSLIFIFLYLTFRFLKWQFGVAAVATLAHDTFVLLAVFSFLRGIMPFALEVDQAFIAALLTVIGYSINDTVIVFDRIREELNLHPKMDYKEVINMALNSTLSRTLITSLTTLFVVLLLFIFGGEVIRGFAFALLIGIIVGTYSSIFVATPIVVDLYAKGQRKAVTKKTATTAK